MKYLTFIIVLVAATVLGLAFYYQRTALNGFGLFFALLGVVFMASMVFKKSK